MVYLDEEQFPDDSLEASMEEIESIDEEEVELIGKILSPVEMEESFYQDRFQTFREENGKITSIYDTSFWNDRIEDYSSFGNIY